MGKLCLTANSAGVLLSRSNRRFCKPSMKGLVRQFVFLFRGLNNERRMFFHFLQNDYAHI